MNPEYNIYEQIDRYLNNTMSAQELAEFNQQLTNNAVLRETLDAQRLANELILDEELVQLKDRMRSDMKGKSGFSNNTKIVLASVLAIISVTLLYLFTQNTESPTHLISETTNTESSGINNSSETKTTISPSTSEDNKTIVPKPKDVTKTPEENISEVIEEETTNTKELKTTIEKNIPVEEQNIVATGVKRNPEKTTTNCTEVKIEAHARIQYENNETEANIVVDKSTVKGGTAPYQFSLDKEKFTTDNHFENVQEGIYHVFIRDQDNCISEIKKTLVVKYPEKVIDEAFTPSQGEKWNFPLNGQQDGTITIQSKTGQIVYTKTISGGYPSDWNGLDNNGNELDAGNYVFIINFTNQKLVQGHISIYK